jgi:hypothetical protein
MGRLGLAFHSCLAVALTYLSRFLGPGFKIGNKVNGASISEDNLASTIGGVGQPMGRFKLTRRTPNEERVSWALEASGEYSTRSVCLIFCIGAVVTHFWEVCGAL